MSQNVRLLGCNVEGRWLGFWREPCMYGAYTVLLAGRSPNIRCVYTVLANHSNDMRIGYCGTCNWCIHGGTTGVGKSASIPLPSRSSTLKFLTSGSLLFRVDQNHIYTVYIRYFWQGNHQTYGHILCIYAVLANPTDIATLSVLVCGSGLSVPACLSVCGCAQCSAWRGLKGAGCSVIGKRLPANDKKERNNRNNRV
jgi:hypothetical protein